MSIQFSRQNIVSTLQALEQFKEEDLKQKKSGGRVYFCIKKDKEGKVYLKHFASEKKLGGLGKWWHGCASLSEVRKVVDAFLSTVKENKQMISDVNDTQATLIYNSLNYLKEKFSKHMLQLSDLDTFRFQTSQTLPSYGINKVHTPRSIENPQGANRCYFNSTLVAVAQSSGIQKALKNRKQTLTAKLQSLKEPLSQGAEDSLSEIHRKEFQNDRTLSKLKELLESEIRLLDATLKVGEAVRGETEESGVILQNEGVMKDLTTELQKLIDTKNNEPSSFARIAFSFSQGPGREHDAHEFYLFFHNNLLPEMTFQVGAETVAMLTYHFSDPLQPNLNVQSLFTSSSAPSLQGPTPDCLPIHLLRFSHQDGIIKKIGESVTLPPILDVPYVEGSQQKMQQYVLRSVIAHRDSDRPDTGHYETFCPTLSSDHLSVTSWTKHGDQSIAMSYDPDEPAVTQNGYLVFYEKVENRGDGV